MVESTLASIEMLCKLGKFTWVRKMPEVKELKDQRIPIMMTSSEVTEIDDWSFQHRIRSRGEAIRRLCQIGLMFEGHRGELLEKFQAIAKHAMDNSNAGAKVAEKVNSGDATKLELELARLSLTTMMDVAKMIPLIRTMVGVANNFKEDKDLKEIMDEAKIIFDITDDDFSDDDN